MTWVVFDYGGVLCHSQSEEAVARMAGVVGCGVPELRTAYWRHRLDHDLGALDGAMFWEKVAATLGRPLTAAQAAELARMDTQSWLRLSDETLALVAEVAAAGGRLALLSNAPAGVAAAVSGLPMAAHFEHLLFSCSLGAAKPDPACYSAAMARMGADPAEVVFIDDREQNVASAAALGMRAVRFTAPEQARAALVGFGVLGG